jgi:hypothetical protein
MPRIGDNELRGIGVAPEGIPNRKPPRRRVQKGRRFNAQDQEMSVVPFDGIPSPIEEILPSTAVIRANVPMDTQLVYQPGSSSSSVVGAFQSHGSATQYPGMSYALAHRSDDVDMSVNNVDMNFDHSSTALTHLQYNQYNPTDNSQHAIDASSHDNRILNQQAIDASSNDNRVLTVKGNLTVVNSSTYINVTGPENNFSLATGPFGPPQVTNSAHSDEMSIDGDGPTPSSPTNERYDEHERALIGQSIDARDQFEAQIDGITRDHVDAHNARLAQDREEFEAQRKEFAAQRDEFAAQSKQFDAQRKVMASQLSRLSAGQQELAKQRDALIQTFDNQKVSLSQHAKDTESHIVGVSKELLDASILRQTKQLTIERDRLTAGAVRHLKAQLENTQNRHNKIAAEKLADFRREFDDVQIQSHAGKSSPPIINSVRSQDSVRSPPAAVTQTPPSTELANATRKDTEVTDEQFTQMIAMQNSKIDALAKMVEALTVARPRNESVVTSIETTTAQQPLGGSSTLPKKPISTDFDSTVSQQPPRSTLSATPSTIDPSGPPIPPAADKMHDLLEKHIEKGGTVVDLRDWDDAIHLGTHVTFDRDVSLAVSKEAADSVFKVNGRSVGVDKTGEVKRVMAPKFRNENNEWRGSGSNNYVLAKGKFVTQASEKGEIDRPDGLTPGLKVAIMAHHANELPDQDGVRRLRLDDKFVVALNESGEPFLCKPGGRTQTNVECKYNPNYGAGIKSDFRTGAGLYAINGADVTPFLGGHLAEKELAALDAQGLGTIVRGLKPEWHISDLAQERHLTETRELAGSRPPRGSTLALSDSASMNNVQQRPPSGARQPVGHALA